MSIGASSHGAGRQSKCVVCLLPLLPVGVLCCECFGTSRRPVKKPRLCAVRYEEPLWGTTFGRTFSHNFCRLHSFMMCMRDRNSSCRSLSACMASALCRCCLRACLRCQSTYSSCCCLRSWASSAQGECQLCCSPCITGACHTRMPAGTATSAVSVATWSDMSCESTVK